MFPVVRRRATNQRATGTPRGRDRPQYHARRIPARSTRASVHENLRVDLAADPCLEDRRGRVKVSTYVTTLGHCLASSGYTPEDVRDTVAAWASNSAASCNVWNTGVDAEPHPVPLLCRCRRRYI